jgi:hypothetical protein
MTTMTQLFKLVTANNYDVIEILITSNKKIDFNCIKSGISLITKAIEVRAIQCFDLLLDSDKLTILQSNNSQINGLGIAIYYHSIAPNSNNKYFINRLLEKNVYIDIFSICNCMHDSYLFDILFNKIEKTYNNLYRLLNHSMQQMHTTIMYKLFNYLNDTLEFYNTPEKRYTFNIDIFKSAILANNLLAIEHLYLINTNLLCVNSNGNMPSLYYTLSRTNNYIIFNYLFSLYEKLDTIQLNQISSIDTLCSIAYKENMTQLYIKQFLKILSLPIIFNNLDETIVQLYRNIYNCMSNFCNSSYINQSNNIHLIMYIILKTNQVKVNPYIKLILHELETKRVLSISRCKNSISGINNTTKLFRRNKYILNHFGFIETNPMVEYYKLLFDNSDKTIYELEEIETIKELENNYNNIINEKVKPIKLKKSKKIHVEINI